MSNTVIIRSGLLELPAIASPLPCLPNGLVLGWDDPQVHGETALDIEVTVALARVHVISEADGVGAFLSAEGPRIVATVGSKEVVAELYIKRDQWVVGVSPMRKARLTASPVTSSFFW